MDDSCGPDFLKLTFSVSLTSTALQLKFVWLTLYVLLLCQLRGLPHQKMTYELTK